MILIFIHLTSYTTVNSSLRPTLISILQCKIRLINFVVILFKYNQIQYRKQERSWRIRHAPASVDPLSRRTRPEIASRLLIGRGGGLRESRAAQQSTVNSVSEWSRREGGSGTRNGGTGVRRRGARRVDTRQLVRSVRSGSGSGARSDCVVRQAQADDLSGHGSAHVLWSQEEEEEVHYRQVTVLILLHQLTLCLNILAQIC